MPHPHSGNVNLIGIDALNSGLPFSQLGPGIAQSLAQTAFGGGIDLQQSLIQAQASTQGAATSANATSPAAPGRQAGQQPGRFGSNVTGHG